MGKIAAVGGIVALFAVMVICGDAWISAYPGISGGVAVIASSPLLLGAGLALSLIGVGLVNLCDPESDAHMAGGAILAAVVALFVVFELVF